MSPRHTSAQRRRKAARPLTADAIEAALLERVRSAATGAPVVAIEAEFAGYFNELGFRLHLTPEASSADVVALHNKLLAELTSATAELEPPFTWIVGFYRSDELLQVVAADSVPQWICGVCNTEHSSLHSSCPYCGSSRP